jgi:hypothetical protein
LAILIAYSFVAGTHFQVPHPDSAGGALFVALFWVPLVVAVATVAILGPRALLLIGLDLRSAPIAMRGTLEGIRPSHGRSRPIYMGMNVPVFPATGFSVLLRPDGGGQPVWVFAGWQWAPIVETLLHAPPESGPVEASYFPHTHALADLRPATTAPALR